MRHKSLYCNEHQGTTEQREMWCGFRGTRTDPNNKTYGAVGMTEDDLPRPHDLWALKEQPCAGGSCTTAARLLPRRRRWWTQ